MSREIFDADIGYAIDSTVGFIGGLGVPGSGVDDGTADTVGIGFFYVQQDAVTGTQIFRKKAAGTGTDKWVRVVDQDDLDAIAGGTTWRDPALVKDDTTYANLAAAETAVNTGTVDGIAVADGDRILFTDITGSQSNIYIVTGTPGAGATLTEDDTPPADGFTVWIQEGTAADTIWVYNGNAWVQRGAGDQTELEFIRQFIGKAAAGMEATDYSSNNVIDDGDDLETAIGKLDASISGAQFDTLGITGGVTTAADSVLVDEVLSVTWKVHVQETATKDTRVVLVVAAHDGSLTTDATQVKDNRYSQLRLGGVAGFDTNVVLSGAGAAQTMTLNVDADNDYDVRVVRTEVIKG